MNEKNMKICFLAPANNYHTKKWCKWFAEKGHDVHVISFIDDTIENVTIHFIDSGASVNSSDSRKLAYLLKAGKVKKIIKQLKPDIVNAHYVSSYGAVAALSGIKSYVLSMWGSDVYDFPTKSFLHKFLVKFSLSRATYLFSTSQAMADEAGKYTNKDIAITPFGVDMTLFSPKRQENSTYFTVGTIKSLTTKYGIDTLLRAVSRVVQQRPDIPLRLKIGGKGEYEKDYKRLAQELGIEPITTWLGFISQERVAKEWNTMDIAVIPSESESFGVSAVEAAACACPVIVTDIPGLKETTIPNKTSLVIPIGDDEQLAEKIIYLYNHPGLILELGTAGRKFVEEQFEIDKCFKLIEKKFKEICRINS